MDANTNAMEYKAGTHLEKLASEGYLPLNKYYDACKVVKEAIKEAYEQGYHDARMVQVQSEIQEVK